MAKLNGKKILKFVIIAFIIIAIIVGIIVFFATRKKVEVSVYSVRDVGNENYWENNSTSQGMIKEDKMQSVYLSSTQKVEKVLVKEGQNVKVGQPLLKYNTTLSNLELERKQIEIKKQELELDKAQKELAKIQTYKPGEPIYGSLPEEEPLPEEKPKFHDTVPNITPPTPVVSAENEMKPAPLTGEGTQDKPYMFIWEENKEYNQEFMKAVIERAGIGKTEVVALFMIREDNSMTGNLISSSKIKFTKKDDNYSFSILGAWTGDENDPLYPNDQNTNEPVEPVMPEIPEVGPIYTASELKQMSVEKENEINDIVLNIKVAKSELKKLKEEAKNNTVYSKIDGIVKTVLNHEDETAKTKPIILVSSGGGYYVQGRIGEFDLNKVKVGQKVNVQSYESGNSNEGIIEKISDVPLTGNYYNGLGNNNVSYYPYTVKLDDSANFKEGEYASLEFIFEEEKTNSFYVTSAFVLSENGKNYAYIAGEGDKLEKRELNIGKNMHGMVEIRGGMTMDDRIAFPYGRNIKEGTPVVDGSLEDLYSGM